MLGPLVLEVLQKIPSSSQSPPVSDGLSVRRSIMMATAATAAAAAARTARAARTLCGRNLQRDRFSRALATSDVDVDAVAYDVVVVGGGVAGAALALRLATSPKLRSHRIAVVEGQSPRYGTRYRCSIALVLSTVLLLVPYERFIIISYVCLPIHLSIYLSIYLSNAHSRQAETTAHPALQTYALAQSSINLLQKAGVWRAAGTHVLATDTGEEDRRSNNNNERDFDVVSTGRVTPYTQMQVWDTVPGGGHLRWRYSPLFFISSLLFSLKKHETPLFNHVQCK